MVESPELRSQVAREGREGWVEEESAVCSLAPSRERFPPQSLMPALPSAPAAPPDPPPAPAPPSPRFWLALALGPLRHVGRPHEAVGGVQAPSAPGLPEMRGAAHWREGGANWPQSWRPILSGGCLGKESHTPGLRQDAHEGDAPLVTIEQYFYTITYFAGS